MSYILTDDELIVLEKAKNLWVKIAKESGETIIDCPDIGFGIVKNLIGYLTIEVFGFIGLDKKGHYVGHLIHKSGTIDNCDIDIRRLFKEILEMNVDGVILFHNHPKRTKEFSDVDIATTINIQYGLSYVNIKLLDHYLVTPDVVISMSESNLLNR